MSRIRRCPECQRYTLRDACAICKCASVCSVPPRYSPDDRYGEYRRKAIKDQYGENGKA